MGGGCSLERGRVGKWFQLQKEDCEKYGRGMNEQVEVLGKVGKEVW